MLHRFQGTKLREKRKTVAVRSEILTYYSGGNSSFVQMIVGTDSIISAQDFSYRVENFQIFNPWENCHQNFSFGEISEPSNKFTSYS